MFLPVFLLLYLSDIILARQVAPLKIGDCSQYTLTHILLSFCSSSIKEHIGCFRDDSLLAHGLSGSIIEVVPLSILIELAACCVVASAKAAEMVADSVQIIDWRRFLARRRN